MPHSSSSASPCGEAGLRERLDQGDEVLVRHEPADRQHPHGPAGRASRRAAAGRRTSSRSALWMLTSIRSRRDPQRPQPLDALRADTTNPSTRGASSRCTRRCSPDSIGSLQGVSSLMTPAARAAGAPRPARASVAGPYSELTTTSGRARSSAAPSPRASISGVRPGRRRCHGAQHLALVLVRLGEPVRRLVPARLARGQVDHAGIDTTALREPLEERLAVRNGDRREDRARAAAHRNFAPRPGRKRLAMRGPGQSIG